MRVAMIGTGYVGLVSGACFADFGHQVTCVDKDRSKIDALERGEMPIYEPGLSELVATNAQAGRLKFTTELKPAVAEANAVFIAVGTPSRRGDGHADLSFVYEAAREIAQALEGFTVVITKSTVPVGTGDEVERIVHETRQTANARWCQTRNSCARARRSRTSSIPTASSSAPITRLRARSWANLPPALSQPLADPVHRPAHGGIDQIRRQCVPCDQGHLHQRDRRPRRKGRRRRAGDRARHWARQPQRLKVPARGSGLRRLVLPEALWR
jgi:predicted dinucleotide-binding enzyme